MTLCAPARMKAQEGLRGLAGIRAGAGTVAGRDGHEIGVQAVLHDVMGVKVYRNRLPG